MDFGEKVEVGSMGLWNVKVGGCDGEIARDDEIRHRLGDNGLLFVCGVMVKG